MISRFLLIAVLVLAACAQDTTESRFGERGPFTVQTESGPVRYRSTNDYVVQKVNAVSASAKSLRDFMANTTSLGWNEYHGTQLEYLGANGVTYLWYPENRSALRGEWRTEDRAGMGTWICFRYSANSYNPVTGSSGSQWECSPAWPYVFEKRSVISGDIFDLSSGQVPFVLWSSILPVKEMEFVLGRAGITDTFQNKADWGAQMRAEIAASAQ
jgi:hypothetical protein